MWGLDPGVLCDQHLLGEHTEMHQEVGTLQNHPHGEAIVRGHADKQQIDTAKIQERHDALAEEMERRGMNHDSPLDYNDAHALGSIDLAANREDLTARCADCRQRIQEETNQADEGTSSDVQRSG